MKTLIFLILIIILSLTSNAQLNQEKIDRFFLEYNNPKTELSTLFSESFLKKVPVENILEIRNSFTEKYGKFVNAKLLQGNQLELAYEKCTMPGRIGFDSTGKVATLWFGVPLYKSDNLDSIKNELGRLAGNISVCVRRGGNIIFNYSKDKLLAVGSSFKLYVLRTLLNAINSKEISWDDSLTVTEKNKSLPSGILQSSPDGYKLSVRKAANLMISISDNTAADMLIDKLTREKIETIAPKSMQPFYKTRELFILKLATDSSELVKFVNSDLESKRKKLFSLKEHELPKLDKNSFTKPTFINIEWLVTTSELCNVIESLYKEEALSLNPGFLDKKKWAYIGYKGGSEPGVLNFTYLFKKTEDSPLMSVSASFNNSKEAIEKNGDFTILISRLIEYFWNN